MLLNTLWINSVEGRGRLARAGKCYILLVPVGLLAWLATMLWAPPVARDLSVSDSSHVSRLVDEWHRGGVIVLVRHLERCSRVNAACLGPATGITARSAQVGEALASEFRELGLDGADIFNSPLVRTAQTAELLFDESVVQDWLYTCADNFLEDALRRKTSGRNLILITHSSCMDESEEALRLADLEFDYGTALFISASEPGREGVLGFIDATDWDLVFGS